MPVVRRRHDIKDHRRPLLPRRPEAWSALTLAVALAGSAIAGAGPARAGTTATTTAATPQWTPAGHLHPDRGFMNDPQRPVKIGSTWHLYYLWNGDWPGGNGTAWRHATSTDLVHWADRGVAIEKYRDGLGDVESGSTVVDTAGTAGFGAGALLAYATQMIDGVQRVSLFGSTDGGRSFRPYAHNPVMDNPDAAARADFRDPKVVRDDARGQWVMALAEGDKIGLYTSRDMISWRYESGFVRDDLGILECPDLFQLDVDGDPARRTWVLGVSANGYRSGRSTGYAYWTGSFDGHAFHPAEQQPQWLDQGTDFYAGVTFSDRSAGAETQYDHRYAVGWAGNWDYQRQLPVRGTSGQLTTTREVRLATVGGRPALTQTPILPGENGVAPVASPDGTVKVVRATLVPQGSSYSGLRVRAGSRNFVKVSYEPWTGSVAVDRSRSGVVPSPDFRPVQGGPVPLAGGGVPVTVVTDRSLVEVFAGARGEYAATVQVFPDAGDTGVAAIGGPGSTVRDLCVTQATDVARTSCTASATPVG